MNKELIREARAFAALGSDLNPVEANRLIFELAEELAAAAISGSTSDGHHTFDELYDYRMLYNAHAAHGWLAAGIPVVKSWNHSDGELCFGGGWFIVTATLTTGQVSNHYKAEHWELFAVPEVDLPPEYDGHTPQDAAERLRAAAGAAPQEPAAGDRGELIAEAGKHSKGEPQHCDCGRPGCAGQAYCTWCGNEWPCLSRRLADALAAQPQVDEAKLAEIAARVDGHEWSRLGGSRGEQVSAIVADVLRGGGR